MSEQRGLRRILAVGLLCAGALLATRSEGAVYYVDHDAGSDGREGKTADTAWKRAPGDPLAGGNAAATALQAGDTVLFRGSATYRGNLTLSRSGAPGNPITYKGDGWGPNNALIEGSAPYAPTWTKCVSADECRGNPDYARIWHAPAPAGYDDFRTAIYENGDFLWYAQDPNPGDPFYYDEIGDFFVVPDNSSTIRQTQTSVTDPRIFTQPSPSFWDNAYVAVWINGNVVDIKQVTVYVPSNFTLSHATLSNTPYTDRDGRYGLLNHLSLIDRAGEYVFDPLNNRIWLWPRNGQDPNSNQYSVYDRGTAFYAGAALSHVTIEGFRIERFTMGIKVENGAGTNVTVRNNEISTLRAGNWYAIHMAANNSLVEGNRIVDANRAVGILSGANNITVRDNHVERASRQGIWFMGASNSRIQNNTVTDIKGSHANGISIYSGSADILVSGNRVIDVNSPITFEASENLTFANNVVVGTSTRNNINDWFGSSGTIAFYNNTFPNASFGVYSSGASYVLRNNVLLSAPSGATRSHNIFTRTGMSLQTGEFVETDLNRLFVDPAAHDYRLQANSPAADAGTAVPVADDLDGTARPQGAAWDIGAYESTPPDPTLHYVRPGADGDGSGSDWANAFTVLPTILSRGHTYYVADGSYGSYTFNDPADGTAQITLKKATQAAHGTDVGWASGYGDGTAEFTRWTIAADQYVLDGQVGAGQGSVPHGFKIYNAVGPPGEDGTSASLIRIEGGASHITVSHVEACRPSREYKGSAVYAAGAQTSANRHLLFSHCFFHDIFGVFFYLIDDSEITIENTSMVRNKSTAAWHAEAMMCRSVNNMVVRYCWFEDIQGTGVIICGSGHATNWRIHGNVFLNHSGFGSWGHGHVSYNRGGANNTLGDVHFYNNTLYGAFAKSGVRCNGSAPSYAYNNYFVDCNLLYWGGINHQYNAYNKCTFVGYNPGAYAHPGPTDQCGDIPATQNQASVVEALAGGYIGRLFVDPGNTDFRLKAATAAGKSLAQEYQHDRSGNIRGADGVWDRGAYEYGGVTPPLNEPPVIDSAAWINPNPVTLPATGAAGVASHDPDSGPSALIYTWEKVIGPGQAIFTPNGTSNADGSTVSFDAAGEYLLRVTVWDGAGSAVSEVSVTVTVLPDDIDPTVTLTAPADTTTVAGTVSVTADATDNVGVAGVRFLLDGATLDAEDTEAPFAIVWNTLNAVNGPHTLSAQARDLTGNTATSAGITVIVDNQVDLTTGLFAHYALEDGTGTTAADRAGNHDGALVNGPAWATGRLGGGLDFDGSDDRVELGAMDIPGSELTLALWFKADNFGTQDARFISKTTGTATVDHYWMFSTINSGGIKLRARLRTAGTTHTLIAESGTLETNTWTHGALVYDGSTMTLYKDGTVVGTMAKTGSIDTSGAVAAWIGDNPPNGAKAFDGVLDDVRIYTRALTQVEIEALAISQRPGDRNTDGVVNIDDLVIVTSHFGQTASDPNWDAPADANVDGVVNIDDLTEVTSNFGKTYP